MQSHITAPLELRSLTDAGRFEGYGAVFGNLDAYDERIAPGAFKASLGKHKQLGTLPAMLWQHDPQQPIGHYTHIDEDDAGLFVKGQLALKTEKGREAYELLKTNAIRGLSIGFKPVQQKKEGGASVLTEVDLWEISVVTFPANEKALISQVKDAVLPTAKEVETILRESLKLSRKQVKSFMAYGFKGIQPDAKLELAPDVLERIDKLADKLMQSSSK